MIVLAEHNEATGSFIQDVLAQRGYIVTLVDNAKELLQVLGAVRAQMLLINSRLPGLGNKLLTLLSKVRNHYSTEELPIILLAAAHDRHLVIQACDCGVNLSLTTPLDQETAPGEIISVLTRKKVRNSELLSTFDETDETEPEASLKLVYNSSPDGEYFSSTGEVEPTFPREFNLEIHTGKHIYPGRSIYFKKDQLQLYSTMDLPLEREIKLVIPDLKRELMVKETARRTEEHREFPMRVMCDVADRDGSYGEMLDEWRMDRSWSESTLNLDPSVVKKARRSMLEPETHPVEKDVVEAATRLALEEENEHQGARTGYEYIKSLGKGSFARVYLVRDLTLGRLAAMKVLDADYSEDSEARKHFLSEARIAARFHHANIASVYQVGEFKVREYAYHLNFPQHVLDKYPDRMNYITMEFVEGKTLRTWMGFNPHPSTEMVLSLLTQITQALRFAHKKGVIHRDIKPANILLTPDMRVKVVDFGIAMLADVGDKTRKNLGTIIENPAACTPKYASPEQLTGGELDARSDLYSLGVMAYEMVNGRGPFKARTLQELIKHHLETKPQPLDCEPAVNTMILKLMAKKPEDRFVSGDELLQSLNTLTSVQTDKASVTLKESLVHLVSEALVSASREQAVAALNSLLSLLERCEAGGEQGLAQNTRDQMCGSSLVNLFLDKLMDESTIIHLQEYFTTLASPKVVLNLLRRFKSTRDEFEARWLAEFALISCSEDQMLLVQYGQELPDNKASILLASFTPGAVLTSQPVYLHWSRHQGLRTQTTLLSLIKDIEGREIEVLNILNMLANVDGSPHRQVRELAARMLQRHLLLYS